MVELCISDDEIVQLLRDIHTDEGRHGKNEYSHLGSSSVNAELGYRYMNA